jgi:hypothetical protein
MYDPAPRSVLWAGAATFKRPDHRVSNTVKNYIINAGELHPQNPFTQPAPEIYTYQCSRESSSVLCLRTVALQISIPALASICIFYLTVL